jgi:cytochrome c oxidase subunit IV
MSSEHAIDVDDQHAVDTHHVDIDKQVKIYITVFTALMALTLITVAISYLHLPTGAAVTVALFVALVKGSLVACYFMHLIAEKKLIYAVLAITVAFFIVLLALPVLTVSDGYWIPEEHPAATAPATGGH